MRLQFLGTGGYHPNERRHTACIMLPEVGVVLDAGTSFFRVQPRLETDELDIFLTHAHLDHIVGLTFFVVPLITEQVKRATIHARPQDLDVLRERLFAEPLFPIVPSYELQPLSERIPLRDGGVLTHRHLAHPGGSVGYRLDWPGCSIAYITDTTASRDYLDFVKGVDLLIHECYFPDDQVDWAVKTGHSHTTPVATLARDAGVGRLILVHIDPQRSGDDPIGLETARSIFPATEMAEDLMEVRL